MTLPKVPPLLSALERGSLQFFAAFRAFSSQFTQTQLIKLAEAHLGTRAFHSSQIGGFNKGVLNEPGPKVFMALGALNIALARSIGHPEELIEQRPELPYSPTLPGGLGYCWEHRLPLLDSEGIAMGPVGLFEAFCGLRELGTSNGRHLAAGEHAAASKALGAFLRGHYARHNIDWFSSLDALSADCPIVRPLLLDQFVPGEQLLQDLDQIGDSVGLSGNALWDHIQSNLGR